MQILPEYLNDQVEFYRKLKDKVFFDLRVALPGIIESFDAAAQTVTVQPTIRERLIFDGSPEWAEIPLLLDVPLFFQQGGDYALTMPVRKGDECLVVFADMCLDGWWQSGGVQNQVERRRHDLSDAVAIVGLRSQPRRIDYSTDSAKMVNLATGAQVEIAGSDINITCPGQVNVIGEKVDIKASSSVSISGDNVFIQGRDFLSHTHNEVQPGKDTSGGVT